MKTYLIVGGHDESFSYIKNMDVEFVIIQIPQMLGEQQKSIAKCIKIVECLDLESVLKETKKLHVKYKIDYIFSFTENGLLPAANAAKNLNIPGIDFESCLLCRDKEKLREYLKNSIFEVPAKVCSNELDIKSFYKVINGPLVLKDSLGSGSKDVYICPDYKEAILALHKLRGSGCNRALAEKFLNGTEFSIETMTINGHHECLGITQKILYKNTVIERQHIYPAQNMSKQLENKLKKFSLELLDYINHKHGPCHIEVITNDDSISLVEINNRGGGDFIWQMVLLVSGVDVIRETLNYAYNNNYDNTNISNKIKYKVMSSIGLFASIALKDLKYDISSLCDIVRFNCNNTQRNNYNISNSWDRFGFLVIGSKDINEFNKNILKINKLINEAEEKYLTECKI